MFDGRSPDDAERMIGDWQAGIEARAAQARELSSRPAAETAREILAGRCRVTSLMSKGLGPRGRPAR